jgi:hypothetical protein
LKFKDERPFASVDAAVKKLLEIANGLEADHAGRLQIGAINEQFLKAGASVAEYKAALNHLASHISCVRHLILFCSNFFRSMSGTCPLRSRATSTMERLLRMTEAEREIA